MTNENVYSRVVFLKMFTPNNAAGQVGESKIIDASYLLISYGMSHIYISVLTKTWLQVPLSTKACNF